MLSGLQKAKALQELRQLRLNKDSLQGLALAKVLKRMRELRLQLEMSNEDKTTHVVATPAQTYQIADKPTTARRQKDNDNAVALLRELTKAGRTATADEKALLSKYTGTGGNLVGEDGLRGSAYEYYTPIEVASSMWDLLKESGFSGGTVLDPSSGIGIFKASAPSDILMHSVELSETSGAINALINDDSTHKVTISPFEKVASVMQDDSVDAVITNVPFGDTSARGENRFFDKLYQKDTLEEYFIKRSLDKLKPNGLAMFIVPTKMLDGKNYAKFRRSVLLKADLLGAYRLPNKVFEQTGADVTTDIVVFKKFSRDAGEKIRSLSEVGNDVLVQAGVLDPDIIGGRYFKTYGKKFVLGRFEQGKGRYGDVVRVVNDDSLANILKLVKKFPESRIDFGLLDVTDFADDIEIHDGDIRLLDGTSYEFRDGTWQTISQTQQFDEAPFVDYTSLIAHKVSLDDVNRYMAYLASTGRTSPDWLKVLANNSKDDDALYYWAVLSAVSHALALTTTQGYATDYPDLTLAMKNIAPDYHQNRHKSKTFGRLYKAVGSAFDALETDGLSGLWKTGKVVQLDSLTLDAAQAYENAVYRGLADSWQVDVALLQKDNPDFNPLTDDDFCVNHDGTKVTLGRDYYVGNYGEFLATIDEQIAKATTPAIKEKLLKQKAHAGSLIKYTDVKRMSFGLMSSIVPFEMKYRFFNEFVDDKTVLSSDGEKPKLELDAKDLTSYGNANDSPDTSEVMRRYLLNRVFVALNNNQKLSISKQSTDSEDDYEILTAKLSKYYGELELNFNAWLKTQKDYMAQLNHKFNDPSNQTFPAQLDGSAFEIDNFNPKYEGFTRLHDYQFEEVRRLSRSFSGVCGFDVGLGKTATTLATIQNLHNIGIKKRTFIVVPNHTLSKWAKDVHHVYDNTDDVLVIGTNGGEQDHADARHNASDFALLTGNQGKHYRKVLMTMEAFVSIPMRVGSLQEYFELGDTDIKAEREKQTGKQAKIITDINKYEHKLPYFEDMVVDSIVFDEAQLYKNGKAGGSDFNRIRGMAQKSEQTVSNRALSARAKAWYVRGENRKNTGVNDGVLLLTATPFTNSPTEVMTMLSLAIGDDEANRLFGGMAINNMNDFLHMFAKVESLEYRNIEGGLVLNDTFTGFQNVQLLKDKIHQVANVQTAKERGLKIPTEDHQITCVDLPSDDKAMLDKMKLFYKIAKAQSKKDQGKASLADELFLSGLPDEVYQDYLDYQATVGESADTIGHAFSLIGRMSDLTLLGHEMAINRFVVLDFDPKQIKQVYKVAEDFNKKNYRFVTTRNYPLSDELKTATFKTNTQTGDSVVEYKVTAQVTVEQDKNRLVLNVDNASMLANLMAMLDRAGVDIKPKLSVKTQALMENIKLELAQPKHQGHSKQLIFCDVLSMHQVLKKALTAYCGIPASQIAILNAQTLPDGSNGTPDTQDIQHIQDLFADNHYTIVIANKKAETGIDLQRGTQAIHHLTTGWTPDSLQQRNGRGVRQGNTQDSVTIYAYNANGTFDEYKRHLISGKSDWIGQLMDKNTQVAGTLTVNQKLSEQDYEDLIEADSAEKIAELMTRKQEREQQARVERIEAKNTFLYHNMLKAKANAKNASFDKLLQKTFEHELNTAVDLLRKKGKGAEARVQKAKQMMNQFSGLGEEAVLRLWQLVEKTAQNRKNSYGGTVNWYNIERALIDESGIFERLKSDGKFSLNAQHYMNLRGEQKQVFDDAVKQRKLQVLGEDVQSEFHQRIKNIISSAITMEQTTSQEFLSNDDSPYSKEERQGIVDGTMVLSNGVLVRHLDIYKHIDEHGVPHYVLLTVNGGVLDYHYYYLGWSGNGFGGNMGMHRRFSSLDNLQPLTAGEYQAAIDYMVSADYDHAYHSTDERYAMQMSDKMAYSRLLPKVYNQVQEKIMANIDDYEEQEFKVSLSELYHKATDRLYGSQKPWQLLKDDEHNVKVKQAYFEPFDKVRIDGNDGFIKQKHRAEFSSKRVPEQMFYSHYLRPFLLANNLRVSLVSEFHEYSWSQGLFDNMYFLHYKLKDMGYQRANWTPKTTYDEALIKLGHEVMGDVLANIDELVGQIGSRILMKNSREFDGYFGEISLDGKDPAIAKRENLLQSAKENALPNKSDLLLIALKDFGRSLYNNKDRLKSLIGQDENGKNRYEWNREQSAWYIPLDDVEKLMQESWFDLDKFTFEVPQKYL